jgi:hypothetical protein
MSSIAKIMILLVILLWPDILHARPKCNTVRFVNNSNQVWDLRDFQEFLTVYNNGRCSVRTRFPCVKIFTKMDFNQSSGKNVDKDQPRRYHVMCGE